MSGIQKLWSQLATQSNLMNQLRARFGACLLDPLADFSIVYQWETGMWIDSDGIHYSPAVIIGVLGLSPTSYWKWVCSNLPKECSVR